MRQSDCARALAIAVFGITCLSSVTIAEERNAGPSAWSYEGDSGPSHWGELSATNDACIHGKEQSPIDIEQTIEADLPHLPIAWRPVRGRGVNNGHTIQVTVERGSFIVLDGTRYDLLQFHFHHPSEHLIQGKTHPIEAHFVHRAESGTIAVLAVFIDPGTESRLLESALNAAPAHEEIELPGTIELTSLLPRQRSYLRYEGSLTTPPCSETVHWIVFEHPAHASRRQIDRFAALYANNARPHQPVGRRFILNVRRN